MLTKERVNMHCSNLVSVNPRIHSAVSNRVFPLLLMFRRNQHIYTFRGYFVLLNLFSSFNYLLGCNVPCFKGELQKFYTPKSVYRSWEVLLRMWKTLYKRELHDVCNFWTFSPRNAFMVLYTKKRDNTFNMFNTFEPKLPTVDQLGHY